MESNNSKQRPMKQYLEWLEKQIDFCLEDKTMQREHWAFCKAYEKFKSFETAAESEELTPYIKYHPNGNVWIKGQKNSSGQREGIWECFWENGNIRIRTPYKEDKKDGIEEEFDEHGNIEGRTPYVGGKIDGIEEEFDEEGNIFKTYVWKDGEIIEETKH
jgi:antitoxin component YwqK of YwqJK toxin-antitoxin module